MRVVGDMVERLGVGHQPEDPACLVANAGDRIHGAVRVIRELLRRLTEPVHVLQCYVAVLP